MCGLCYNPVCSGFEHLKPDARPTAFLAEAVAATPLADVVSQLNRGNYAWDQDSPITYTFAQTLPAYAVGELQYAGFGAFNARQMDMTELALATWSDVADLSFAIQYRGDADISFANSTLLAPFSAAHAYLPGDASWGGDIWVNSSKIYNLLPTIGSYGFQVLIHEIGHAIGQPHPGDYNANAGVLSYANNAAYVEDSGQYSIMSYWDETHTGADFGYFYAQTPMLHDVAAIQAKYGANMTTRADDTVYGFNSTAGSILFDFSKNKYPVLTLWDAGGTDTLDLSGYAEGSRVDLNPGAFSSVAGLTSNLSIAYGADIEHALTGIGNDHVTGNRLDNIVDLGAGDDVFHVNVDQSLAQVYVFDDGRVVVHSRDGTDQLENVERISFENQDISTASYLKTSILEYAASYADIAAAFGTDKDLLYAHFVDRGLTEGRTISFSALDYIASYDDLSVVIGNDSDAGARHYIEFGRAEGRDITFDADGFLAAHPELAEAVGRTKSAAELYLEFGLA